MLFYFRKKNRSLENVAKPLVSQAEIDSEGQSTFEAFELDELLLKVKYK